MGDEARKDRKTEVKKEEDEGGIRLGMRQVQQRTSIMTGADAETHGHEESTESELANCPFQG